MMHNKRLKISLSVLAIIALFAFLVLAAETHTVSSNAIYSVNASTNLMTEFDLLRHGPTVRDFNLSGTLSNLSFAFAKSGPGTLANEKISNISIMWQLRSNNSFMLNITLSNRTGSPSCPVVNGPNCNNMSSFNVTIDTTQLPDGTYNLTVFLYNFSEGPSTINATNVSLIVNITIDNTPPVTVVTSTNNTAGQVNVSPIDGATFTHLNAFNQTLAVNVTDALTGVKNVTFSFNNATGGFANLLFNRSAVNRSDNVYLISYNFSTLRAGVHTVTVFAFDFAHSLNKTITYTFTLNTPMNVTYINRSNVEGLTFSVKDNLPNLNSISRNGTTLFNVSVQNSTQYTPLHNNVTLTFDNTTGLNFNISLSQEGGLLAGAVGGVKDISYFSGTFNISNLRAGLNTVTVFANDSLSNINRTERFTFTINTAPNVTSVVDNLLNNTLSIEGKNFTELVYNKTFNLSVQNASGPEALTSIGEDANGKVPIDQVILMFNTNGTPFNRTAGLTNTLVGGGISYFSVGVNLSAMSEGNHVVTVFTNDTWGNLNKTQAITFTVDKTAPAISVSCSPSSVAPGGTVNCECTASDATSGLIAYSFGNGERSESLSASTVGSHSSSTCTATDYAGHVSTATDTYTVASSGGSGASGSSGGSSSGATGQFEKKVWASINAGETAAVSIKNGVIGVTEVSFSVPSTVWGGWVQVAKKATLPSSAAAAFTGKVYRNLEITKGPALKDDVIRDAKVEFKVEKAWLLENKLPKESVALHRYADGAWTQLTTRVAQEDEAYVHYVADTPGFSYFVIGEKVGLAAPVAEASAAEAPVEAPVAEAPAEEVSVAAELKKLDATGWVVALVAAVVIIAAVLIYLKRRR